MKILSIVRYLTAALSLAMLLPLATNTYAQSAFELEITTHLGDKQTFRAGDTLSLLISINREAYLLLIYQDANGDLIQIMPNARHDNNFYQAGFFFGVPNAQENYRFEVKPPFGRETVHAYAFATVSPQLEGDLLADGFKKLSAPFSELDQKLRTNNHFLGDNHLQITTTP